MFIENIKIKDFRNIVRADVDFGKINIITGKNSSGKSNFLLALANSVLTNYDYKESLDENIVTFAPGKKQASIITKIRPHYTGMVYFEKNNYVYLRPYNYIFEKVISKKTSQSIFHKLFFSGKTAVKSRKEISENNLLSDGFKKIENSAKKYTDKLVEHIVFDYKIKNEKINELLGQDNVEKYVEYSLSEDEHKEKHYNYIKYYSKSIAAWISDDKFSSNIIYDYVVNHEDSETYGLVIKNLKSKKIEADGAYKPSQTEFKDSKFIFLLSDIQRNEDVMKKFQEDIKLYTQGILDKVYINTVGADGTRGEIFIDSPNGPKDIFSISTGTAVLLFFITLKHWLTLNVEELYYKRPYIMIFDEIDSIIHPTLLPEFNELLKSISNRVQLFISTHSPRFINFYKLDEIYVIKDRSLKPDKGINRSNIYSYKNIIDMLPDNKYLSDKKPSELFIDGIIDNIF